LETFNSSHPTWSTQAFSGNDVERMGSHAILEGKMISNILKLDV
jgi:hypothetical protein